MNKKAVHAPLEGEEYWCGCKVRIATATYLHPGYPVAKQPRFSTGNGRAPTVDAIASCDTTGKMQLWELLEVRSGEDAIALDLEGLRADQSSVV